MKKFLIISCLTPSGVQSPLRKQLFDLCLQSIRNQTWPNWEAILIGETEGQEGQITRVKTDARYKRDKLLVAQDILLNLRNKPDYVLRLDDDDLLAPDALERAVPLEFDCYADKYHAYYNIVDGKVSLKKFPWLPNTVIHKFEHIVSSNGMDDKTLAASDHSKAWKSYYKRKRIIYSKKEDPLYLRIFSPTTVTTRGADNIDPKMDVGQMDMNSYQKSIAKSGKWQTRSLQKFEDYIAEMAEIWENLSYS